MKFKKTLVLALICIVMLFAVACSNSNGEIPVTDEATGTNETITKEDNSTGSEEKITEIEKESHNKRHPHQKVIPLSVKLLQSAPNMVILKSPSSARYGLIGKKKVTIKRYPFAVRSTTSVMTNGRTEKGFMLMI